jgi:hypothetical protein
VTDARAGYQPILAELLELDPALPGYAAAPRIAVGYQ